MAGFCELEYGCTGRLTINSVPIFSPAWVAPDLTRLWFAFEKRGESTLLPGASGRRSNPTRLDETVYDLPFFMNGLVNQAGTPYANAWDGLRQNFDYLYTNVFGPVPTGRGTLAASMLMPDGVTTRTADVRVEAPDFPSDINDPTFLFGTLTIVVPAGRFV